MADKSTTEEILNYLKGKLAAADYEHVATLLTNADEADFSRNSPVMAQDKLARSVARHFHDLETARSETQHIIGNAGMAYDSAIGVYGAGLRALGKNTADIPQAGMQAAFRAYSGTGHRPAFAMDQAAVAEFDARHPEVSRIK